MSTSRKIAYAASALAAVALLATAVRAGEHERDEDEEHEHLHREDREHGRESEGGRRRDGRSAMTASPVHPVYAKECGACHLAFPPSMLPAASWTKLMAGLDRHFGQNAELDAESRATVERWLVERAGSVREGGTPLRVTELGWFRHEHRKVEGAAARPAVKSMANCAACHTGAERWDFDEDGVKIPRG